MWRGWDEAVGHDAGSYENFIDALIMIGMNGYLLLFVILYWLSIAFYNFFSLSGTVYA